MRRDEIGGGEILTFTHAKAGGRVAIKVKRINPKNIKGVTASGKPWNVHPSFLRDDATDEEKEAFDLPAVVGAETTLTTGQVIRFRDGREGDTPFVIIARYNGLWRATKLGGDSGRYYSNIAPEMVEVLDINLALEEV